MASNTSTEDLLKQVPMFAGLDRKELRHLADVCMHKRFAEGELIIEEGKAGLGLYIMVSGRVEVFKGSGDTRQVLVERGPGTSLGEMGLIDSQPRWASVLCLEQTDCLLITRDSFHDLVKHHAGIAWCLVPELTQRFRGVEARMLELMAERERPEQEPERVTEADTGPDSEEQTRAAGDKDTGPEKLLDLMRLEYAMLLTGAEGLEKSAGILRDFVASLARDTDLANQEKLEPILDTLPEALKSAGSKAIQDGERLPERLLASFRRELSRR